MTRAKLLALAARVEAAPLPSRGLDADIARTLHPEWRVSRDKFWSEASHDEWCIRRDGRIDVPCNEALPAYTASLDAALTLVPDGMAWGVSQNVHYKHWIARVQIIDADGGPTTIGRCDYAATPALALTAASLRARAEELSDE